ncbi:unnamed protein product [Mytilus coruscus]|uniref:Transposase Tc1-like domain-containing protein n=1 Tax=Mytilus coruscus TaxID=42192 RepID=A0A6J8AN80_MYTCO|nr:unnamed protein product [Mytilus coruscus]
MTSLQLIRASHESPFSVIIIVDKSHTQNDPVKVNRISLDLRQRIVNIRQSGKSGHREFYTRFRANGTLSDPPKAAGRRKTLQDRHLVFIDEKIHADREISAQELTRELNARFHINISVATIKRARKSLGWTRSATQYCQMVRHQNKPKRLDYALRCLADNEQFDDVIFTDETTVKIQTTTGRSFRKEGEPVIKTAKPKHPYQVSIHFPYCILDLSNSTLYLHMLVDATVSVTRTRPTCRHKSLKTVQINQNKTKGTCLGRHF